MFKYLLRSIIIYCFAFHAHASNFSAFHGVWRTDGYGWIIFIQSDVAAIGSITENTCNINAIYDSPAALVKDFDLTVDNNNTLQISAKNSFTKMTAYRVPALPLRCQSPMEDTPKNNFLTFTESLKENYGFFDLYRINWDSRIQSVLPRITPGISDELLLSIFVEMMSGINDAHLSLEVEGNTFSTSMSQTQRYIKEVAENGEIETDFPLTEDNLLINLWINSIPNKTLNNKGKFLLNEMLQYGVLSEKVGYISLLSLIGYDENDETSSENDVDLMHAALDKVFTYFNKNGIDKVVFDISFNRGGYDKVSLAIASRFAHSHTHAFSKRALSAKNNTRNRYDIIPSKRTRFKGDIYLLTSDMTISAGEIFTIAMRSLPNVTHVGQETNGALSDILSVRLPNNWLLNLSNELYLNHKGISWEGKGIPPSIFIPVFPKENLLNGHHKAVELLLNRIEQPLFKKSTPVPSLSLLSLISLFFIIFLIMVKFKTFNH